MESTTLLELVKELTARAEEIGRLRAESDMKSRVIDGLKAQLSLGLTSTPVTPVVTPNVTPLVPTNFKMEPYCTTGLAVETPIMESVEPASIEVTTTTEAPVEKPRRGRKPGKKPAEVSVSPKTESVMSGGSVFKEFVPLTLDNMSVDNPCVYMPPEKNKSHVLTVL